MKRLTFSVPRALPALAILGLAVLGASVPGVAQAPNDQTLAEQIAQGIIAACPIASPNDERARDQSADQLTRFSLLRDALRDPIFWGAQTPGKSYQAEDNQTTRFNTLVWRGMYLSLFMFTGEFQIERMAEYTIVHMPCRFRNELDPGAYPYPFWHSQKKWESYQRAIEVRLVIENGKIVGGYRSAEQDPVRSHISREWDGRWRWTDAGGNEMPYVALYQWLFSPSNPHVAGLDAAYRAFEAEARPQNCVLCHSPANPVEMNPLRLLNYPNQALTVRHEIVGRLVQNSMPPPGGIANRVQRKKLIALAKQFAELGDKALEYERELKPSEGKR
jgi:hypothetical protein